MYDNRCRYMYGPRRGQYAPYSACAPHCSIGDYQAEVMVVSSGADATFVVYPDSESGYSMKLVSDGYSVHALRPSQGSASTALRPIPMQVAVQKPTHVYVLAMARTGNLSPLSGVWASVLPFEASQQWEACAYGRAPYLIDGVSANVSALADESFAEAAARECDAMDAWVPALESSFTTPSDRIPIEGSACDPLDRVAPEGVPCAQPWRWVQGPDCDGSLIGTDADMCGGCDQGEVVVLRYRLCYSAPPNNPTEQPPAPPPQTAATTPPPPLPPRLSERPCSSVASHCAACVASYDAREGQCVWNEHRERCESSAYPGVVHQLPDLGFFFDEAGDRCSILGSFIPSGPYADCDPLLEQVNGNCQIFLPTCRDPLTFEELRMSDDGALNFLLTALAGGVLGSTTPGGSSIFFTNINYIQVWMPQDVATCCGPDGPTTNQRYTTAIVRGLNETSIEQVRRRAEENEFARFHTVSHGGRSGAEEVLLLNAPWGVVDGILMAVGVDGLATPSFGLCKSCVAAEDPASAELQRECLDAGLFAWPCECPVAPPPQPAPPPAAFECSDFDTFQQCKDNWPPCGWRLDADFKGYCVDIRDLMAVEQASEVVAMFVPFYHDGCIYRVTPTSIDVADCNNDAVTPNVPLSAAGNKAADKVCRETVSMDAVTASWSDLVAIEQWEAKIALLHLLDGRSHHLIVKGGPDYSSYNGRSFFDGEETVCLTNREYFFAVPDFHDLNPTFLRHDDLVGRDFDLLLGSWNSPDYKVLCKSCGILDDDDWVDQTACEDSNFYVGPCEQPPEDDPPSPPAVAPFTDYDCAIHDDCERCAQHWPCAWVVDHSMPNDGTCDLLSVQFLRQEVEIESSYAAGKILYKASRAAGGKGVIVEGREWALSEASTGGECDGCDSVEALCAGLGAGFKLATYEELEAIHGDALAVLDTTLMEASGESHSGSLLVKKGGSCCTCNAFQDHQQVGGCTLCGEGECFAAQQGGSISETCAQECSSRWAIHSLAKVSPMGQLGELAGYEPAPGLPRRNAFLLGITGFPNGLLALCNRDTEEEQGRVWFMDPPCDGLRPFLKGATKVEGCTCPASPSPPPLPPPPPMPTHAAHPPPPSALPSTSEPEPTSRDS